MTKLHLNFNFVLFQGLGCLNIAMIESQILLWFKFFLLNLLFFNEI